MGNAWWVNQTHYHLRLSLKAGISDTIEVYQGKADGWDIWGLLQKNYLAETGYQRTQVEPDKLFSKKPLGDFDTLNVELIGHLPLIKRIKAYLENGQIEKALILAKKSISPDDMQRSQKVIELLAAFRSIKGIDILDHALNTTHQPYLKRSLISALGTIDSPQSINILLTALDDTEETVRDAAIESLDTLDDIRVLRFLVAVRDDNSKGQNALLKKILSDLDNPSAPELLSPLLQEKNKEVRQSVVSALGRLGDSKAVEPLIRLLKDENAEVRKSAVSALGRLGDSKAVEPLIRLLKKDEDAKVRESVVKNLPHFKDITVLHSLINLRNDILIDLDDLREVLSDLDDPKLVEILIPLLKDGNSIVLSHVAWLLGRLGDAKAVGSLIPLLEDENSKVRASVAQALGRLGDAKVVDSLIALLEDKNSEVRASVSQALGRLGDAETVDSLIPLLKDKNSHVRESVAQALGSLGDVKVVDSLIALLKDYNFRVRYKTAQALVNLGSPKALRPLVLATHKSIETPHNPFSARLDANFLNLLIQKFDYSLLIELLKDENADVRNYAAKALGYLGDSKTVDALIALLKDENIKVRNSATKALGNLGDSKAIEPLILLLKDENAQMRNSAIQALVNFNDAKVVKALITLLKDENHGVRYNTVNAFEKIGNTNVEQFLISLLKDESKKVRHITETALLQLGSAEAIRPLILRQIKDSKLDKKFLLYIEKVGTFPLIALLKDEKTDVRNYARKALDHLGDFQAVGPLIISMLEEKDKNIQYRAAETLIYLGDVRGIRPLMLNAEKLVKENDGKFSIVRKLDIKVLNLLIQNFGFESLKALLKDENTNVRQNVAKALSRLDNNHYKAIELLLFLLKDVNPEVRLNAVKALGDLGEIKVVKHLIPLLKDENRAVRLKTVEALGQLGNVKAVEHLIPLLQEYDESIRHQVAETLGILGIGEAINSLIISLKSPSRTVQQDSAKAIGSLGSLKAVDVLVDLLKEKEVATSVKDALCHLETVDMPFIALSEKQNYFDAYRDALKKTLKPLKYISLESLIERLKDENTWTRHNAAKNLGKLSNPKAVEPLIKMLKDQDEEVRDATLLALRKIGDHRASEAVLAVLNNDTEKQSIRIEAATTLLAFHQPEGLTFLTKLANSVQVDDRKETAKALGNVSSETSIQLLVTLLTDDNLSVKLQAIESLGQIKAITIKHIAILHALLEETNVRVQTATVKALTRIASPDSIPVLRAAVMNPKITIPARLAAFSGLQKRVDKETFIEIILEALKQNETLFGLRAYTLLGQLKVHHVLPMLQNRLMQLEQQVRRWRGIRDKERQYFTETQSEAWRQKLETAQPAFHWAFELAHAMAQIDPVVSGVKLLSHHLAEVRYGAWMDLGQVGTVALVQRLEQARMESENPLFRHAAYRAIDRILNRLEVMGSEKELNALKAFLPQVRAQEAVYTRVEWTIQQLEYRINILTDYFPDEKARENIAFKIEQKTRQFMCREIRSRDPEIEKRKELYKNFQKRVIKDEDVPPGMRVVRTPFGDRLVPIK
ncbi:MAG TPA: hypothetical protein EYP59_04825, partial [Thiotrichaceae bacterium]|nr:hypothetical protein [Thiotrichaceae bacterium]